MKQPIFASLLGVLATVCTVTASESSGLTLSTTATLRDGSTLKGTLLTDTVTGAAIFDSTLKLKAEVIQSLSFADTNGTAKASLVNGDVLTLTVTTPAFEMNTSLGRLSLVRGNVKSLSIARRKSAAANHDGLIFHCTFDDATSITAPTVGPAGKYLTGRFVAGRTGNALRLPTYTPCATFDLPEGFFGESGCIEMWIKLENQSPRVGAGGDPRLFMIFDKATTTAYPVLMVDFVNNDGMGNSGVSSCSPAGHTSSISGHGYNLSYQQLFPKSDWRAWHHVALVWDANGIPGLGSSRKTATFIDGDPLPAAAETSRSKSSLAKLVSSAYFLCFTGDPNQNTEQNTKSPFLVDDFKIWNHAKTTFDLQ